VKPARSVIFAVACVVAAGCSGLDFTPGSVETWSGPPFPVDRVASIDVLPVADVRTIDRGASVRTAQLVREGAQSLLREKGYGVTASGDALAAIASAPSSEAVLDPLAVADRSPSASGFALALALEQSERDVLAAPATTRIRLRGTIVDLRERAVVWAGASVAEAGSTTGAIALSPGASLYTAIVQAVRALLADLPARP
jgi:hypothetical protein